MKENIVKLSKRLMTVSDFIKDNSFILDIGCDHALLDIYLYQKKNNLQIIASDIRKAPLENAKNNINRYGLTEKIETRLGDGLEVIDDRVDTIIITGMGGKTIIDILSNKEKLVNVKNIVLSPNSDYYEVRKAITNLGYIIDNETIVKDKGIYYLIISFVKGNKKYKNYELLLGPILIKSNDKTKNEYFKYLVTKKEEILKNIPRKYILKRLKLKCEIHKIKSNILS